MDDDFEPESESRRNVQRRLQRTDDSGLSADTLAITLSVLVGAAGYLVQVCNGASQSAVSALFNQCWMTDACMRRRTQHAAPSKRRPPRPPISNSARPPDKESTSRCCLKSLEPTGLEPRISLIVRCNVHADCMMMCGSLLDAHHAGGWMIAADPSSSKWMP
eukprot:SAG31_NODE_15041_length_773_cov_1.781899_1_plen_162_part_00